MKALTVRPPWSWCIADGHKLVENRSRPTRHRGPLATHAAAAWDSAGTRDPRVLGALSDWLGAGERSSGQMDAALHAGRVRVIVAVVDLVDCHRADGCCAPWGEPTGWHWVLANPRSVDRPELVKGRLGLWDIDQDAVLSINR